MADWDADSPELRRNLGDLLRQIRDQAPLRRPLTRNTARQWQQFALRGLATPLPAAVGRYRGEPGLETLEVSVGPHRGVPAAQVSAALAAFEQRLTAALALLDRSLPPGQLPFADQLAGILELCAWAHAEWVRIHPFANGNGRTARLWANAIALRYGLPPFLRLRPRPDGGYARIGEAAMRGAWQATVPIFRRMLLDSLKEP